MTSLVVPLRSNASTLLTGTPIVAMRRRLKYASVFYDEVLLESGILRVQAGPRGSSSFISPPTQDDPARWQTPAERHAATGAPFAVAVAPEGIPGATPRTVISSQASISWTATLHPFEHELPAGTDWVHFVTPAKDPPGDVAQLVQKWTMNDRRNPALKRAMPNQFVRGVVIDGLNRDVALAAVAGAAVTVDQAHINVVEQRFRDEGGWQLSGYAVPMLFPRVGELPWSAVTDLRRDRNMTRFRAVLREVENEAIAEAAGGDIEAAAHHVYERHLAAAVGTLDGIGGAALKTGGGIVVSGGIGFATSPITGPLGIVVGALVGAVPGTFLEVRDMIQQRRTRGWVALAQRMNRPT